VAVAPFDRGDQGGSNGGGYNVAVAVLSELWQFEKKNDCQFFFKNIKIIGMFPP
jgi:hypothetical protein